MGNFLSWYLVSLVIGWVNLPLSWRLFKALPSRGFHLSRPIGLLLWGYLFWMLTSLKLLNNDLAGQLVAFGILLGINLYVSRNGRWREVVEWVKINRRLVFVVEGLFLGAFALWAFVRSANPTIAGTEKPMEMAFINAILRSPSFPPNDPWLSGYGISYYYFGYVLSAMLIRVTGVTAGVGYNLVSALWFGLTAICAYGLLFDLLATRGRKGTEAEEKTVPKWVFSAALLAPVMLLVVSNWHGFLDILNSRGLFWSSTQTGESVSAFWNWLNLKELTTAPSSYSWFPTRIGGVQWWGASRVVQDFQLNGQALEVIDEFPFFTYLLSDIHPHVLAMPFVFLAISQALNAILGGWQGKTRLFRRTIPLGWPEIALAVITLGGIAFLNTWDFPFYLVLIAVAICYQRYTQLGWSGSRIKEFFLICFGFGIPAILAYFPFYVSFSSQAGGILPSLAFFTQGKYFWVMFGPLLVPILGYLVYQFFAKPHKRAVKPALLITGGLFLFLLIFSWGLSFMATKIPSLNQLFLSLQGANADVNPLLEALVNRIKAPGTWITLFVMIFLALSLLLGKEKNNQTDEVSILPQKKPISEVFVLFLVLLGTLLTLAPEFVYLKDQFGTRMNTIFKFYYQAWILWSVAGSYALISLARSDLKTRIVDRIIPAVILVLGVVSIFLGLYRDDSIFQKYNQNLGALGTSLLDYLVLAIAVLFIVWLLIKVFQRQWKKAIVVISLAGIAMGLVYPVVSLWNKTGGFSAMDGFTLDGMQYYRDYWPDQMAAVDWLSTAPMGVMVEAVSPTGGGYTTYASVSTFSGMPTVLGWVGHVSQWRGGYTEMGSRQDDIQELYSTHSWEDAQAILKRYNIRYVYVGELEERTYALDEEKFKDNLVQVFELPNARIYEYPPVE
ncbi:MAG: DUF2298 domain-containing protein [Anaerolineaceae bacterium]